MPGNIRQLRNVLERAAILNEGSLLTELDVPSSSTGTAIAPLALESVEKEAIGRALNASQGNRRKVAEVLGIGLRTLYEKLKRYGLG